MTPSAAAPAPQYVRYISCRERERCWSGVLPVARSTRRCVAVGCIDIMSRVMARLGCVHSATMASTAMSRPPRANPAEDPGLHCRGARTLVRMTLAPGPTGGNDTTAQYATR